MFRKRIIVVYLLVLSCKSYDNLAGKKYTSFNQEKSITIEFINDTLCRVQQEFFCNDLPENYKRINFNATYKVDKMNIKLYNKDLKLSKSRVSILVVNNIDCSVNCEKYQTIPNYEELGCSLVAWEDEKLREKVKLGVIYNLINDTLIIQKNQILFDNLKLKQQ